MLSINYRDWNQFSKRNKSNHNLWENQQIESILGHPVKRVICDKQGNIILDIGDIISFRALEQVKRSNQLDYLFASVYRK